MSANVSCGQRPTGELSCDARKNFGVPWITLEESEQQSACVKEYLAAEDGYHFNCEKAWPILCVHGAIVYNHDIYLLTWKQASEEEVALTNIIDL